MSPHATLSRRRLVISALGLAGGALALRRLGAETAFGLPAETSGVGEAAVATEPAERLVPTGEASISFPCDTTGGITLLDNFGGDSASNGSGGHRGVDMWRVDAQPGQPLLACVDGVLASQRVLAGAQGNAWIIEDANGDIYRYHHLDSFADRLAVGDVVRPGDVIGYMGSSGNAASNAPHLHFEVRRGGTAGPAVDPVPLFGLPLPNVTLV
ncbi:MAG: M23 family metallopeptidase [Acidimicrobiia bacterium]|nr:M23 family metallopeptidase [Acidimicrobiia bacterium]